MARTKAQSPDAAPAIVWFRDDLRVSDHPALTAAVETGRPVLPLYVFDQTSPGLRPLGGAARWWLDRSLRALAADLGTLGATLRIVAGEAGNLVPQFATENHAFAVFWSRRYEPGERALDDAIERTLERAGVEVKSFGGTLWHEPDDIRQNTGGWYKIYTPYWRQASAAPPPGEPLRAPTRLRSAAIAATSVERLDVDDLGLLPRRPDRSGGLAEAWTPGEKQAQLALEQFIEDGLDRYGEERDKPAAAGSSRLSPHLRFGEISPLQIIVAVEKTARAAHATTKARKFLQEIVWRDFAYNLLAHAPDLRTRSFSSRFDHFHWAEPAPAQLEAWRRGRTGYPIVDAGMRQLWQTGWMHNRVRMITASFLCKHLLADWRIGEAWFWDTLCDADPANNVVNWQWVAGTGPDAAPFFRIFNPVTQGEKFDPDGNYVRRFVPELAGLDRRWIHRPWQAPPETLAPAGIVLGKTYPRPIVDHAEARQRALDAFAASRQLEPERH